MAPKNSTAAKDKKPVKTSIAATSTRVTRSSTRQTTGTLQNGATVAVPAPAKITKKKKAKSAPLDEVKPGKESGSDDGELSPAEEPVEAPKKKKAKVVNDSDEAVEVVASGHVSKSKTVVIEHCKQCNQFMTRAAMVKEGLEKGVTGITVLVNPDKPRRGCFEIREEGGEKFVSLLDMKRPFTRMRELNMNQVLGDIVEKIK